MFWSYRLFSVIHNIHNFYRQSLSKHKYIFPPGNASNVRTGYSSWYCSSPKTRSDFNTSEQNEEILKPLHHSNSSWHFRNPTFVPHSGEISVQSVGQVMYNQRLHSTFSSLNSFYEILHLFTLAVNKQIYFIKVRHYNMACYNILNLR